MTHDSHPTTIPLCVDLDNTLIQGDSTRLLALQYFKQEYLLGVTGWTSYLLLFLLPSFASVFKFVLALLKWDYRAQVLMQAYGIELGSSTFYLLLDLLLLNVFIYLLYRLNRTNLHLLWLAKSSKTRAQFKAFIAQKVPLTIDYFHFIEPVLHFLKTQKQHHRKLVLVSGTDQKVADFIAAHVGLFDEVKGSDGHINLIGANKAQWLEQRFGKERFDYVGDSYQDLAVWPSAREAYYVKNTNHEQIQSALATLDKKVHILNDD
jgi:phosphoserine phosphatase